jgi:signal transduction histidine kinase
VSSDHPSPPPGDQAPYGRGRYVEGPVHREPPEPAEPPDRGVALTFPDLPRLELDQLLTQLVDRAQEVMATQGRLRGLLRANQLVVGDLTLPTVLRHIVDAARELVGAHYCALGVISPAGGLAEFVHSGMPEDEVTRIGHLPQGKGLLGALIDDPRPIRLRRIADEPRSSGFPPRHPPMESFLGVPIRLRDEVFGNLYFAESTKGQFSEEDEELATALAATAAVAVENARLYEAARSRGEWLQASAAITRQLLSPEAAEIRPLQLVAERSRENADADLVTVSLPNGGDELYIDVAVGIGADTLPGSRLPIAHSLPGRVFSSGHPLRLSQTDDEADAGTIAPGGFDAGPVLVVPLLGSSGIQGVLSLVRQRGRTAFSATDLDMAGSFANHAAIALELAQARADQQRAAMLGERDRIASDLHDQVIQRLFAAGLSLQSVAMSLDESPARNRVLDVVRDLDAVISQIRTTIFQLHDLPGTDSASLRAGLLDVVADSTAALGFEPTVTFDGPIDTLPREVGADVVAVLREALSNVARHADARTGSVEVTMRPNRLTLAVHDEGVGIGATTRRSGLRSMRRRAERHGGTFDVATRDGGGTTLRWSIPRG